eukprot:CAMPEP_0204605190 /NCGR_PEP_ID=MMETSP0661-20131031/58336_1 /ASSEMBLY_ACC=CAM_ASM_000606 /TAXON_ID=109239 /ORGANISM="Alexandrium margalefi, Strain AMGDE01CS-322" /LENGTH=315 /DNA_ID=CAMNT_0051616413 /DNA_START=42 /DNA_END=989 /DNA_ORIENTATION=+
MAAADTPKERHLGMEARLPRTEPGATRKSSSGAWKGFVQGSVGAAVGGSCAHPLDLIKVRMQLQTDAVKLNMAQMGRRIATTEGMFGLFKGVDASAARQLVYSGTRFGMYDVLKQAAGENERPLSMLTKVACAACAGAVGAFAGNPGDLAMVRMQADGKLPEAERRGYKNIFDAVGKIARTEGVLSMWRTGVVPNMNRATIITVGQLAAYDQCKQLLVEAGSRDGLPTHFGASFMAAFIASVMSNPVDVAKTRLMNQKEGAPAYSGTLNVMTSMVRQEGPLSLYKGFAATFARQCPYVVITWVTVEQLKKVMKDW